MTHDPAKHLIFIHDTPYKYNFSKSERALSSGCVRAEEPVKLAEYMLRKMPDWPADSVQQMIKSGKTKRFDMEEKTEVWIYYLTAWVADDWTMNFRQDIYKKDQVIVDALDNVVVEEEQLSAK